MRFQEHSRNGSSDCGGMEPKITAVRSTDAQVPFEHFAFSDAGPGNSEVVTVPHSEIESFVWNLRFSFPWLSDTIRALSP